MALSRTRSFGFASQTQRALDLRGGGSATESGRRGGGADESTGQAAGGMDEFADTYGMLLEQVRSRCSLGYNNSPSGLYLII